MTDHPIIAVDGPAASGKGTLARKLAAHFDFAYLDTGALYRAVAVSVMAAGGRVDNEADAVAAAKRFAQTTRVVFKITVTSGRNINAYSFFPQEGEVLLSPSHRFTVCSEPHMIGGYTIIDLVQVEGSTFVS